MIEYKKVRQIGNRLVTLEATFPFLNAQATVRLTRDKDGVRTDDTTVTFSKPVELSADACRALDTLTYTDVAEHARLMLVVGTMSKQRAASVLARARRIHSGK